MCASCRHLVACIFEQLVDLLLVLDDRRSLMLGVLSSTNFISLGDLRPGRAGPAHRPGIARRLIVHVEARAVVADDREIVAPLEAQLGQAAGERTQRARRPPSSSRIARCRDPSRASPAILSGRTLAMDGTTIAERCPATGAPTRATADSDMNVSSACCISVSSRSGAFLFLAVLDARLTHQARPSLHPPYAASFAGPRLQDR